MVESEQRVLLKEGFLQKKSTGIVPRWQKRYFAVDQNNRLRYAESAEALHTNMRIYQVREDPRSFNLKDELEQCTRTANNLTLRFSKDGRLLELQAPTEQEAESWEGCFQRFIADAADAAIILNPVSAPMVENQPLTPRSRAQLFSRTRQLSNSLRGVDFAGRAAPFFLDGRFYGRVLFIFIFCLCLPLWGLIASAKCMAGAAAEADGCIPKSASVPVLVVCCLVLLPWLAVFVSAFLPDLFEASGQALAGLITGQEQGLGGSSTKGPAAR